MISIGLINLYYNHPWWKNVLRNIFCPIWFDKKNFDVNGLSIILYMILLLTIF